MNDGGWPHVCQYLDTNTAVLCDDARPMLCRDIFGKKDLLGYLDHEGESTYAPRGDCDAGPGSDRYAGGCGYFGSRFIYRNPICFNQPVCAGLMVVRRA